MAAARESVMQPAARMVCRACLQSVEVHGEGPADASGPCPFCGSPIDSRTDEALTVTKDRSPAAVGPGGGGSSWAERWNKGTMGTVGRFQLRELLGNGGFGQVYLAFDPRLDRDVALKLLRQPNPGERVMQRFFREARAAGRLYHPNIVAVHDAGRDDDQCWIAYEYIKGSVLTKAREQGKVDLEA